MKIQLGGKSPVAIIAVVVVVAAGYFFLVRSAGTADLTVSDKRRDANGDYVITSGGDQYLLVRGPNALGSDGPALTYNRMLVGQRYTCKVDGSKLSFTLGGKRKSVYDCELQ